MSTARRIGSPARGGVELTVRDATFDFLRRRGLTDIFSNPGSTEIPFLTGLPDDLNFVLGLHEGSVVSMASGYALARRRPSFALLHTTPGFGNAVNAIATARVNRTPIVIAIGQQDRRHIAFEPFLAGRLDGLAGDYPVWVSEPSRAQDVPGALERAYHEAETHRGPAIVIVPMGDWLEEAGEPHEVAAPQRVLRPGAVDERVRRRARRAARPLRAAGARRRRPARHARALGRARGAGRAARRAGLPGAVQRPGRVPAGSPAVGGPAAVPASAAARHARALRPRARGRRAGVPPELVRAGPVRARGNRARRRHRRRRRGAPQPGRAGDACRAGPRLSPRSQRASRSGPGPDSAALPAAGAAAGGRAAAGGPRAAGARRPAAAGRGRRRGVPVEPRRADAARCRRGSRSAWSARRWAASAGGCRPRSACGWACRTAPWSRCSATARPSSASRASGAPRATASARSLVVLKNGGYRIMDQLAARQGGPPAWPSFGAVDIASIAEAFGCEARRIGDADALEATLDEVVPGLRERTSPLLLEVTVEPEWIRPSDQRSRGCSRCGRRSRRRCASAAARGARRGSRARPSSCARRG